jgi:hypothetical protein
MSKDIVLRMNILGGMNEFVADIGDEDILENWITYGVPDSATEDDLKEIAEDDECFADVCMCFANIVKGENEKCKSTSESVWL